MNDRCLARLEELELENQRLVDENVKLEELVYKREIENKELKIELSRLKSSIEKYERSLGE